MTIYVKKATAMRCIAVTFNYQLSIINCQFLVYKVILLRAEAWEGSSCTYAVTTLGHNLINIYLRSSVAQNISFHNAFEI